jgi:hypothetical protein
VSVCALALGQTPAPKQVTWTGWFADSGCAAGRLGTATATPPNPECALKCIRDGAAPVFISEQAKALFKVSGYPSLLDDLGYHLEVTAQVDEAAKTISVQSVKRISEYQGPSCAYFTRIKCFIRVN